MIGKNGFLNKIMDYELYQPVNKKKANNTFNESVNFCQSAKELTRETLTKSDEQLQIVVNEIKKQLSNNDC